MSDYTTEYERTIRSTIQPRNVIIQRSAFGGADQRQVSQNQRSSSRSSGALVSSSGGSVGGINDKRKQEKKDMQDLNERFASYIEKVRFLEAQNRKLSDELDSLKTKWGKQTTVIKSMYEADLEQVKKLLEETEKDTSALQIKVAALEEKIDELKRKLEEARQALDESRNKLEQQISQIASLEAEANLVRLRTELLEGDKKDNKNLLLRLQDALTRARADLDRESNAHVNAEEERQALEEELEFLKELHDQELRELAAQSYVDPTNANREMWKSEMGTALKQMQQLYDEKMDELKADLDTNYSMQMQTIKVSARPAGAGPGSGPGSKDETIRIRTQTNELRNRMKDLEDRNNMLQREIDDLRREKEDRERELEKDCEDLTNDVIAMRAEMEAISRELGNLVDAKLGLEMEIEAYRKLLEGETNQEGLKQVVDSMFNALVGGQSSSSMSSRYGGEESSSSFSSSRGKDSKESGSTGRTTFQRSAKGPLAISECTADGKCVIVENTGKKTEDLGGWSLKRTVDSKEIPSYTFKQGVSIEAHAKLRLYTKGEKPSSAGPNDIETDLESFGVGQNITTQLFNPAGQDRASHIQKTVQN